MGRIYRACRHHERATTAKAELEAETGRRIFEIVVLDVADLGSVHAGLAGIDGCDALVMNAGVIGPQSMGLTADGVTTVFATNVLGHVVLLEGLLADDRPGEVVVFAGSEQEHDRSSTECVGSAVRRRHEAGRLRASHLVARHVAPVSAAGSGLHHSPSRWSGVIVRCAARVAGHPARRSL